MSGPRRFVREVGLALVTAGFVVLLFVAYELVGTNLSEEHSQALLARDFNAAVAGALPAGTPITTVPAGTSPKHGPSREKAPSGRKVPPVAASPQEVVEGRRDARRPSPGAAAGWSPGPYGDPGHWG